MFREIEAKKGSIELETEIEIAIVIEISIMDEVDSRVVALVMMVEDGDLVLPVIILTIMVIVDHRPGIETNLTNSSSRRRHPVELGLRLRNRNP